MSRLVIDMVVFNSPVGPGKITGFSQRGYPKVNDVTVSRLIAEDKGDFFVYDPHETFARGDYALNIRYTDDCPQEAVQCQPYTLATYLCTKLGSLPCEMYLGEDPIIGEPYGIMYFLSWVQTVINLSDLPVPAHIDFHLQSPALYTLEALAKIEQIRKDLQNKQNS